MLTNKDKYKAIRKGIQNNVPKSKDKETALLLLKMENDCPKFMNNLYKILINKENPNRYSLLVDILINL